MMELVLRRKGANSFYFTCCKEETLTAKQAWRVGLKLFKIPAEELIEAIEELENGREEAHFGILNGSFLFTK